MWVHWSGDHHTRCPQTHHLHHEHVSLVLEGLERYNFTQGLKKILSKFVFFFNLTAFYVVKTFPAEEEATGPIDGATNPVNPGPRQQLTTNTQTSPFRQAEPELSWAPHEESSAPKGWRTWAGTL